MSIYTNRNERLSVIVSIIILGMSTNLISESIKYIGRLRKEPKAVSVALDNEATPSAEEYTNSPKQTYVLYSVKENDNLTKIAKVHSIPLKELLAHNSEIKNPDLIYLNQKIKIPFANWERSQNLEQRTDGIDYLNVTKR